MRLAQGILAVLGRARAGGAERLERTPEAPLELSGLARKIVAGPERGLALQGAAPRPAAPEARFLAPQAPLLGGAAALRSRCCGPKPRGYTTFASSA